MYLILIGTGFLASVAFSLFLRRMTNSGHYLSRLKKTIHLHEHTLVEVANQQSQKIKDSFLDYEILVQQGQQTQSLLQKELEEYSGRLEQLRSDKALVKELSIHLNEMAASANTVSQRVENLDLGMQKLSHAEQEIQKIHGQLDLLHTEIEEKRQSGRAKTRGSCRRYCQSSYPASPSADPRSCRKRTVFLQSFKRRATKFSQLF